MYFYKVVYPLKMYFYKVICPVVPLADITTAGDFRV